MIENVPSFTSLRVSDALKDLVLEIARTFSLALLWRQVMLAGTGNELIADEDRSPGRIGELHCVDAEILRLCVRDWVRAALQKRLGVGMRRQEPFDRIGIEACRAWSYISAKGSESTPQGYSGKPIFLRRVFTLTSPRTSANSGNVKSRPSRTGPAPAMSANCSIVWSLSPSPANARAN